jgi:hypothetical protein
LTKPYNTFYITFYGTFLQTKKKQKQNKQQFYTTLQTSTKLCTSFVFEKTLIDFGLKCFDLLDSDRDPWDCGPMSY